MFLARALRALGLFERECFILATILMFMVMVTAFHDSEVLKIERQPFDPNASRQTVERKWSILMTGGVKYLSSQANQKGGKGTNMAEPDVIIPSEVLFLHDQSRVERYAMRSVVVH